MSMRNINTNPVIQRSWIVLVIIFAKAESKIPLSSPRMLRISGGMISEILGGRLWHEMLSARPIQYWVVPIEQFLG